MKDLKMKKWNSRSSYKYFPLLWKVLSPETAQSASSLILSYVYQGVNKLIPLGLELTIITYKQNHRVTEIQSGPGDFWAQIPSKQYLLQQALHGALNIPKPGDFTLSLGNLLHCLITLTVKETYKCRNQEMPADKQEQRDWNTALVWTYNTHWWKPWKQKNLSKIYCFLTHSPRIREFTVTVLSKAGELQNFRKSSPKAINTARLIQVNMAEFGTYWSCLVSGMLRSIRSLSLSTWLNLFRAYGSWPDRTTVAPT